MKSVIIDSHSLLYKAFYGVREMRASDGTPTNAVYGFMNMLLKLIRDTQPDCVAAAFDAGRTTFRNDIYPEYKAGRDHMPEDMRVQVSLVSDIMRLAGIKIISLPGYEADDIIGSFSRLNEQAGNSTLIVTGDRDSFQLCDDDTGIIYAKRGVTDTVTVTPQYIEENYGFPAVQLIQLKALMGDKSDNIPGITGVGEKTATELIKKYGTLDNIYAHIEDIKGKLQEKLIAGKDNAYMSLKLGEIKTDLSLDVDFTHKSELDFKNEALVALLSRYELNNILKQIGAVPTGDRNAMPKICSMNKTLRTDSLDMFFGRTAAVLFRSDEIKPENTLFISCDDNIYIAEKIKPDAIKKYFEDGSAKKITHDLKTLYKLCLKNDIKPAGFIFDTFIAAYLLNATDERYSLENLARKYLDFDIISAENTQQSLFDSEKDDMIGNTSSVFAVSELYKLFSVRLREENMEELYYFIEHKLIFVLADMEFTGFKVDTAMLSELGRNFDKRCGEITAQIQSMAGGDGSLNINSPKQLGELLFVKLGLPVVKQTKTGYSTDIEVLEKLKDHHPIIPLIIELRQMSKLNSTYVKGLLRLADKDDLIHTNFNQTITTTGRISSSEPNLQNIPVRTDEGRVLRKAFIPMQKGRILVDADYSQIELRILAHISGDENMRAAFERGEDIHARTASEVFGVPIDKVTKIQRSRAKAVNFGIVYGISDFGLSRNTGISRKEARQYIETYLEKFSGVKKFMEDIVAFARENGYVETMYHRKRYIPDIKSVSFTARSFAERTALNTPIQGTAADIIKIAMVNVSNELKKNKLEAKLILQVHDELIIDAPAEEKEEVLSLLKEQMENAAKLSVPLSADIAVGDNWFAAK